MEDTVVRQLAEARGSKYHALAEELRARIGSGRYTGMLPGKRLLAEEFGTTTITVAKAVELLKEAGLVRTESGRGTFVTRLKRPRTHTIGIILHSLPGGGLHHQLMSAFHDSAREAGQQLLANGHLGDPVRELALARELAERPQVDGIILWPASGPRSAAVDFLRDQNVPRVVLPEPDLSAYADTTTVSADDAGAVRRTMAHLWEQGRRRIGFVAAAAVETNPAFTERHVQFREFLLERGLHPEEPVVCDRREDWTAPSLPSEAEERLRGFDAVVCVTDTEAAAVISLCAEHRIRVPHELAVTGYDNSDFARALRLTSVEQHFERIGARAFDLLLDEIEGRRSEPVHLSVDSELIVRASTGGLPHDGQGVSGKEDDA
jgi:DNA-binding LacI/PurR family transcriptional regulator